MRTRIQRSMTVILVLTLGITVMLFSILMYQSEMQQMERDVTEEAFLFQKAVTSKEEALSVILEMNQNRRITLIETDGTVIYDSEAENHLENHKEREEVIAAIRAGEGTASRASVTLGKRSFYYAVRLDDGVILRISDTTASVWGRVFQVMPVIIMIGIVMSVFAWVIGKWQTKRLVQPIYELDLEHPLENKIYEELMPFLKKMEEKNKMKEEVAQMRKEFSANVSHELKTPLTSISGYAEIMKNGIVKEDDVSNFAGKIYDEAGRLIVLIEDIIKLSKLEDESIEPEKEEFDLYEMSREICTRLALLAEKKKVRLEVTGEHVTYYGIQRVIDEMIYNITENAIKYNHEHGLVSVWVGNTLNGPKVSVTDTGIGIPKEQQERIFERFYRVDKSHSKESGGTGLGLSIVKHGALLHQARIEVESEEGKGTKMSVFL